MLIFKNPSGLFLVLAVVFIVVVFHVRRSRRLALPLEVFRGNAFTRAPALPTLAYYGACLMMLVGWLFVALAWTEPVHLREDSRVTDVEGIVLYIVDCSPSMAAADVVPTRFARAVRLVEGTQTETSMMGGLIAFGKDAALVCPPTANTMALLERLRLLRPGQFGEGTDILKAVKSALLQVSALRVRTVVFVIITDGEDEESLRALVPLLKDVHANIVLAAVGKEGDAPISYLDPATQTEFSGIYKSGFNAERLREIASEAGIEFLQNPERIDIPKSESSFRKPHTEALSEDPLALLEAGFALLLLGWFLLFVVLGGKL